MTAPRIGWAALLVAAACSAPPASDADAGVDAAPATPTWTSGVAALVHARCAGCHRDGGGAPFALTTHADVAPLAQLVRLAVTDRVMPPWPAESSGACRTYRDARWLTDDEIALVQAWVDAGAPRGDGPAPVYEPPAASPFDAAARVEAAGAFTVMPGPDEYRCFVVDPGLTDDRYLTALRVVLDRPEVVHHIQLYALDAPDDVAWARGEDAADEAPGFSCFGVERGTYLEVWGQGDTVRRYPPGVGQRLTAGTQLLYQIHYHAGDEPVSDRTAVELELTDDVARPAAMLDVAGYPLELPPGQPLVEVTDWAYAYADGADVVAARLHMHGLGVRGRIDVEQAGGTVCALDIPRWNVDWQMFYTFDEPIPLGLDDRVRVTCAYDTTGRDTVTTWGVSAADEMCLGYLLIAAP